MAVLEKLKAPERYKQDVTEIDDRLEVIRARFGAGSPRLSFAPGGHTNSTHDLSDYYAQAEDLIKRRRAAVLRREMAVQDVLRMLTGCTNDKAREMLLRVYIQGQTRTEAAAACGMSYNAGYMAMTREIAKLEKAGRKEGEK